MGIKKENIVNRIYADGRNVFSWSRIKNHNPNTVHAVISGRSPSTGYAYKAITADLKADGYMTDEDEQ